MNFVFQSSTDQLRSPKHNLLPNSAFPPFYPPDLPYLITSSHQSLPKSLSQIRLCQSKSSPLLYTHNSFFFYYNNVLCHTSIEFRMFCPFCMVITIHYPLNSLKAGTIHCSHVSITILLSSQNIDRKEIILGISFKMKQLPVLILSNIPRYFNDYLISTSAL